MNRSLWVRNQHTYLQPTRFKGATTEIIGAEPPRAALMHIKAPTPRDL